MSAPGPSRADRSEGWAERVERARTILTRLGRRLAVGGDLGSMTTYRVGGAAALRVTAGGTDDLMVVADAARASGLEILVVGRGSNLLVSDAGFGGIAVLLDGDRFGSIDFDGPESRAGAAVALPALARRSVEAGLSGLEWAVGVPGSVGGAVRMNAGGHGSDTAASLRSAVLFDLRLGRRVEVTVDALDYRYRHSAVAVHQVVTEARFALTPGRREQGRDTIRDIVRWRRDHQPGGQNAGSVFTNPAGDSAGRLIEAAGLKGRRKGTAMVSTKHANFIQADPGGSAEDVFELIGVVRHEVEDRFGVDLVPELRLIGFPSELSSRGSDSGSEVEG